MASAAKLKLKSGLTSLKAGVPKALNTAAKANVFRRPSTWMAVGGAAALGGVVGYAVENANNLYYRAPHESFPDDSSFNGKVGGGATPVPSLPSTPAANLSKGLVGNETNSANSTEKGVQVIDNGHFGKWQTALPPSSNRSLTETPGNATEKQRVSINGTVRSPPANASLSINSESLASDLENVPCENATGPASVESSPLISSDSTFANQGTQSGMSFSVATSKAINGEAPNSMVIVPVVSASRSTEQTVRSDVKESRQPTQTESSLSMGKADRAVTAEMTPCTD